MGLMRIPTVVHYSLYSPSLALDLKLFPLLAQFRPHACVAAWASISGACSFKPSASLRNGRRTERDLPTWTTSVWPTTWPKGCPNHGSAQTRKDRGHRVGVIWPNIWHLVLLSQNWPFLPLYVNLSKCARFNQFSIQPPALAWIESTYPQSG